MERLRRWVAVALWAIGVVCIVFGWLNAVEGIWVQLQLVLGGLAFGAVGLVLAIRSGVAMGWLFLAAQSLMGLSLSFDELSFGLVVLLASVLLVYPSGRLPSRRWAWAVLLLCGGASMWLATDVFRLVESESLSWTVYFVSSTLVMTASSVRIIYEYRRAVGQTRQQLKWLAWILLLGGMLLVASATGLPYLRDANQIAGIVLFVGGPIAIGFAVTRYRLYEIDRIISRTVTYALLVGVLAAAVVVLATLVGTRFDSPLIVAGTTLGVAAVFNPLRARIQKVVDRRFNRAKYDHERVVEQFTATLQHGSDLEDLRSGLVGVVSDTMQPRHMRFWMRFS